MDRFDIIIIGAGPAGLSAAVAASRFQRKILLLDKADQPGKKILVTGNGKCNLTNEYQDISCYRTEEPEKAREVLSRFDYEDTLAFFEELGILTRKKKGYLYPYNEQAASVREAFVLRLGQEAGVTLKTSCRVDSIRTLEQGYRVICGKESYRTPAVILAAGGLAGSGLGCDGSGYDLAKSLGHRLISTFPALTALRSSAPFLKKISGVRNQAEITLMIDGKRITGESGELQWTDYGISGVCVFQLSRYAVIALEAGKKVSVLIDLVREWDDRQLADFLEKISVRCSYKNMGEVLKGILPRKLVPVVLKEAGLTPEKMPAECSREKILQLVKAMKAFPLRINGYMGYEKAQVTRGGISFSQVSDSLESLLHPGLFFAGEILDVDGTCGGYNLQWAFSSGNVAGKAAGLYGERIEGS